ncbi:MAG: hypothetical protein WKI04_06910 [Ferruginibacter sp.]
MTGIFLSDRVFESGKYAEASILTDLRHAPCTLSTTWGINSAGIFIF